MLTRTLSLLAMLGLLSIAAAQPLKDPPKELTTSLTIKVPQANAKLLIDQTVTRQQGLQRQFVTPTLEAGKNYSYQIVVIWEPNNYTTITRTKKVTFKAGENVTVDMTVANNPPDDKIKVRYVPTPNEIVDEMLKLANVGKDDVVFDLGCGDGRLVCRAVALRGAKRGVGVDIDPERIQDSIATAKQYNVSDKVEFRKEDVLNLKDISEANVVLLYMGQALNERLKPILKKSLKPGSRVVSHRFTMGDDWKPDKTIKVTDKDGDEYYLHLWIIRPEDNKQP